ncbi:SPFH domain-containing protein [Chloroflexota bacterium]
MIYLYIILGIALVLVILALYMVKQQTFAIIERFGKFQRIAGPGIHMKIPFIDRKAGFIPIRVQELNVKINTKTKDNVFVDLLIAVQFYVKEVDVWNAFYKLTDSRNQMESYVFDIVRAKLPTMILDDVFEKKEDIAIDIQENLKEVMPEYGFTIKTALVNDIQPDKKVADAMNEINTQQRLRVAAEHEGEAKKVLVVKAAEADAESKKLSGIGIADQRKAIVEGLRDSVKEASDALGVKTNDVMTLVLVTQYYDMLTEVGKNSSSNTILVPHSPGAVGDLKNQLLAVLETAEISQLKKK